VGEAAGVPGFYVCCGFEGHGFMMAPVVARHYARYLMGEAPHTFFTTWRADRFTGGDDPAGGERETMTIG
jgi:sarcosine oxidase subunit beta